MTNLTTLNDAFADFSTMGGIFAALQALDVPWKSENISFILDLDYYGNISGQKYISPLLRQIAPGDALTADNIRTLAHLLIGLYGINWAKQWATMSFDYNPIDNYSMKETMEDDKTVTEYGKTTTRTDNLTHGKTGTETRTEDLTDVTNPDLQTNTSNTIHGFNSTDGVPTGEQSQIAKGINTDKHTGTETMEYNLSNKDSGTQDISDTGTDSHTRNYTLTRSGNIGVTTSQQMIESERNLWLWNYFREVVYPDIDKVLTLQIY